MDLGAYLKEAAGKPWKAGEHDCTAWPARWAGVSLPSYSSDDEGAAMIEAAGGLVSLWDRHIGDRFARVAEPDTGDVGIIRAVGMDGRAADVGAIFTGKRWAFPSHRGGIACVSAVPVAIWRV